MKIQISGLISENQKLQDKLRNSTDSQGRTVKSLEVKVNSLSHDLELCTTELADVQAEYEAYKVCCFSNTTGLK